MKNEKQLSEWLVLISEKFDKELSQGMIQMIKETLKPFPDQECKDAMKEVLLRGRFFKDLLPDLMDRLDGGGKAMEAWQKVDKAIQEHGAYDTVVFDDPRIAVVIDLMGGWVFVAQSDNEQHKWNGINFQKHYAAVKAPRVNRILPGVHDKNNISRGFEGQKVVQIGDPVHALDYVVDQKQIEGVK